MELESFSYNQLKFYFCFSYIIQALKQLPRDKIQLATKFGCILLEEGQYGVKGTPEYVRKCCEASLKRLDVDYIDLYHQHRVDTLVPIEDTVSDTSLYAFLLLLSMILLGF